MLTVIVRKRKPVIGLQHLIHLGNHMLISTNQTLNVNIIGIIGKNKMEMSTKELPSALTDILFAGLVGYVRGSPGL